MRDAVGVGKGVSVKVAVGVVEAVAVGVSDGGSVGRSVGDGSTGVLVIVGMVGLSVGVALGRIAPGVPGAMVISLSNFGGAGGADSWAGAQEHR